MKCIKRKGYRYDLYVCIYIYNCVSVFYLIVYTNVLVPVVPHKAVAEVAKVGNLEERLVVVNHGWHSEFTDGPKGGWSCFFWSGCNGCSGHLVGHLTRNCWM